MNPDTRSSVTLQGSSLTLGPPGTGKTTRAIERLVAAIEAGTPTSRIAFVAYTRAAKAEVLGRVRTAGLDADDLPWLRTIHSMAYRLLGLQKGSLMGRQAWTEFANCHGYEFSDLRASTEDPVDLPGRTDDDLLRQAHEWARQRRRPPEAGGRVLGLRDSRGPADVVRYARRLAAWKAAYAVRDYTDLLEHSLASEARPEVDLAFCDEAQDLTPLMVALVRHWFGDRVQWHGDEDQCIFSWQGADPRWIVDLAASVPTTVLEQSYRVPRAVHGLASKVIRRNRVRVEKDYRPRDADGVVERRDLRGAIRAIGSRSAFVLVRNRMFMRDASRQLYEAGLPYVVEGSGASSPLSATRVRSAVRAATRLGANAAVAVRDVRALLEYVPSAGMLPRGAKSGLKKVAGELLPSTLRAHHGLGKLIDRIAAAGPLSALIKLGPRDRAYLEALVGPDGELPEPTVRVLTIHSAKGRETDDVVVVPEMTRRTWRAFKDGDATEREAENRVAYVAATRARERLILVRPEDPKAYPWPTS